MSENFVKEFTNPLSCHARARGNRGDSENGNPGFRLALATASLARTTVRKITKLTFLLLLVLSAPAFLHAQNLPTAERQKIEALIKQVGDLKDAKFVRNGSTYEPSTAARFIRGKWDANDSVVKTAQDFVDKVASSSGTSGKPYLIRFKDGREVTSRAFLLAELKKLEP
jgi:hypothetical protein